MLQHRQPRALPLWAFSLLFLVGTADLSAQQPTAAQIQAAMGRPGAAAAIRQRIQASGLTPEQVRARLKAAGYSEALLDDFLGSGTTTNAGAPSSEAYRAIVDLGIVAREEAASMQGAVPAVVANAPVDSVPPKALTPIFGLSVFRQSTSQFMPDVAGPVDPSYTVGPRDVLALIITGGVEASYSLEVTREGFIVIPQVGQVFVANLTLEQIDEVLYRRLRSVYSNLGRAPNSSTRFYVTVVRLRTNQVFVIGEAQAPASYQVASVGTILTALYGAGGPSDIGSLRAIELRRNGERVATFDAYDYLIRGDGSNDRRLETGDVIFIPVHGPRVHVSGQVKRPATYELKTNETLADALAMAGGFSVTAAQRRVLISRVVPPGERARDGGRDRTVLDVTLQSADGFGSSLPLQDGDSVQVFEISDRTRNAVHVGGAVWNPGPQGLTAGLLLSEALARAGGVRPDAIDVIIRRLQSDLSMTTLRAAFTDTLGTLAEDLRLQEDDSVTVYATSDFRPNRYVAINGAVRRDGRYSWREGMTLRDLIHEAGGLEDGAYLVRAEVARLPATRRAGILATTISVPLDSSYLLERGLDGKYLGPPGIPADSGDTPAFALSPYDNVLIFRQPEWLLDRQVTILGEVRFPGTYGLLSKGERLSSVIERAGGVLPSGYPEAAVFTRTSRGVGRIGFDLRAVLEDSTARDNMVLEPGDTLAIPRYIPTVQVSGAVNSPIAVAYIPGKRLRYYVEAAGGDTYLADFRRAFVRQPNGVVEPYRRRLFLPDRNPKALPGATVVVPEKDPDDRKDWTAIAGSVAQILASAVAVIAITSR
jgi:polysaccharide export outer membrane protein